MNLIGVRQHHGKGEGAHDDAGSNEDGEFDAGGGAGHFILISPRDHHRDRDENVENDDEQRPPHTARQSFRQIYLSIQREPKGGRLT